MPSDYVLDDDGMENSSYLIEQNKISFELSLMESAIRSKHDDLEAIKYFDVIIIGAGLSGLSAGYYLKKADKNIRILIIEAKNRVGGRTQTIKLKSSKEGELKEWDVGGQWVILINLNH